MEGDRAGGGGGGRRLGAKGPGGVREVGEEGTGSRIPEVAGSGRKREKIFPRNEKMQRGRSQQIQDRNWD